MPEPSEITTELAAAKINLTLHVGRIIADPSDPFFRYHPVDSLVVFADLGDRLTLCAAKETRLTINGPFGVGLEAGPENLVLKALNAVNCELPEPLHFEITLEKNLPIASGIGGGSADAAAMLRALQNFADLPARVWAQIAQSLGADVPVCLLSRTAHMTGIGENVAPYAGLGSVPAVLVNPAISVSTAKIYTLFDGGTDVRETPRPQLAEGSLLARAQDGRNDLEPPAIALEPVIKDVISALSAQSGCGLSRMSGSGATCFGLFRDPQSAQDAATKLAAENPNWWVRACRLGGAS